MGELKERFELEPPNTLVYYYEDQPNARFRLPYRFEDEDTLFFRERSWKRAE